MVKDEAGRGDGGAAATIASAPGPQEVPKNGEGNGTAAAHTPWRGATQPGAAPRGVPQHLFDAVMSMGGPQALAGTGAAPRAAPAAPWSGPAAERIERAWAVLDGVLDPEVPALSVRDLGIVRDVVACGDGSNVLEIVLTPTYSGCPATEAIERGVLDALDAAGLGPARVTLRRAPAWTTDWISADGRRKLAEYGIAPPGPVRDGAGGSPLTFHRRRAGAGATDAEPPIACPHCASLHTERLSAFGATACKALHRCLDCLEPFEHFKAI